MYVLFGWKRRLNLDQLVLYSTRRQLNLAYIGFLI